MYVCIVVLCPLYIYMYVCIYVPPVLFFNRLALSSTSKKLAPAEIVIAKKKRAGVSQPDTSTIELIDTSTSTYINAASTRS